MGVLNDPKLEALLDTLHAQSVAQDGAMGEYFSKRFRSGGGVVEMTKGEDKRFVADKLVALDREKAEFCYLVCRSLQAKRIVEAGTSFGVSTLYLAAALRDNAKAGGEKGVVIATEYEPEKAKAARANFAAAGLSDFIDLREGDLRETLKRIDGAVDFALIDIWVEMIVPAITLAAPHMRKGAVAIADNTTQFRKEYGPYFDVLSAQGFRTATLPFAGGLEYSVKA